jgi:RHS repeat-associated protein
MFRRFLTTCALVLITIAHSFSQTAEPTTKASNVVFSNVTANSLTITWTNGNGAKRIVLARESTVMSANYPVDGTAYSFNTAYTAAPALGSNKVVYNGTGNTFTMTGLTTNKPYALAIFEYNGDGTTSNYQATPVFGVQYSGGAAAEPTTAASNLTFEVVSLPEYGVKVSWTSGNGSGRVVFVREGQALTATGLPVDGYSYSANNDFTIAPVATPNKVVYNGTGNSFILKGITPDKVYGVGVFEYNGAGDPINYLATYPSALIQSATSLVTLNNFGFQYRYDARKRMTAKKVPGADWVYMVYDDRDRLVMTQDANQRAKTTREWTFTKYDALNRPILTGIYADSAKLDLPGMQQKVTDYYSQLGTNQGEWYESFTTINHVHGYTNKSFPKVSNADSYLTVTYYDNYNFKTLFNATEFDYKANELTADVINGYTGQSTTYFPRVTGQVTATKVKMLTTATWLKSVNYYDDKYRVIQTIGENPKGHEVTTSVYDFVGKVLRTKSSLYTGQPITWKNIVNAQVQGDDIASLGGGTWGSGASSVQTLPANTDGWVEWTVTSRNVGYMMGLSQQDVNTNYTSLAYAVYINTSSLTFYEGSTQVGGSGDSNIGDIFRVERVNGVVYYKRNGNIIKISPTLSTSALVADLSLRGTSAKISKVRLSSTFTVPQQYTPAGSIVNRFTYDHAGRLLETWHQLNESPPILLSKNEYNELGQLVDKKLHATSSTGSFKQSVDYRYNIRGWLTSINNAELNTNSSNDETGDLFGMNLAYNDDLSTGNANTDPNLDLRQYNGNISAIKWSKNLGLSEVKESAYNFKYDPMNRLTSATHLYGTSPVSWQPGEYDENGLTYDLNGNIKTLQRRGDGGVQIDNLVYNYGSGTTLSNRLLFVTDNTTNTTDKIKGFTDGSVSGNDYGYDANGNMLFDKNKGITSNIQYNHLNLPAQVSRGNSTIAYHYDATGRKLGQHVYFSPSYKFTEYIGPWVFENNQLQFVQHGEGRIVLSEEKAILKANGDDISAFTPTANATISQQTLNGNNYIKVQVNAGITLTKLGAAAIGGTISVTAGEEYIYRVKGYSASVRNTALHVKGSAGDIVWFGATMPTSAVSELWVEQRFTIPAGVTWINLGVLYTANSASTSADYAMIREVELIKVSTSAPEYQYHMKDHLGNVRLTFTTKQEQEVYTATLENNTQTTEQNTFRNYSRKHFPLFDHTDEGAIYNHSQLLNGGNNSQVGLAKTISVMPGDTIKAEVYAKYRNLSTDPGELSSFALALTTAFGLNPAATGEAAQAYGSLNAYGQLIADGFDHSDTITAPKAYLNILLFNKDHNLVDAAYRQIDAAYEQPNETPNYRYDPLTREIIVSEPGYAYIFLSNEHPTQVDVYFDDLKITHAKGPVVQADDYYPFGLTFNGYRRENSVGNEYLYNGKENQDELGLGWLDYGARMYIPEIARWGVSDPLSEVSNKWSPYVYALDNPIMFIDPDGRTAEDFLQRFDFQYDFDQQLDSQLPAEDFNDPEKYPNYDIHNQYIATDPTKGSKPRRTKFVPKPIPENPHPPLTKPVPALLWLCGQIGYGAYNFVGLLLDDSFLPGPQMVEQSAASSAKVIWNLTQSVLLKKHHNWAQFFGHQAATLDDVSKVVMKAVENGEWKSTGKVLHGNGGTVVGEGVILNSTIDGKDIWVEGTKLADGSIIIKNAGVN